uniref:Uncharacterized conserved protein, contains Mth938-like domain n=1 Tax=Candidatus Kentrum sp. SD TaxID=2126332 RepID=A0A450YWI6_9GAMM|nr:MAG: Uncharacterized conserved protein, contains Mth938-like domain [Candidatus Kentron sp. SD]VFK49824.1 MAG: Uncharacterized conserved protein, contains Mth938-like domain [Candidatus Kentron sp. SD]
MSLRSITLEVDDDNAGYHRVTAYDAGYVAVDGERFTRSLILTPSEITDWPPQTLAEVTADHIALLTEFAPEVILFGSGKKQQFPAQAVFRICYGRGIGIETMNTPAACRTYNLLVGERRRVVAALLMPDR